jgi:hypothetical protein
VKGSRRGALAGQFVASGDRLYHCDEYVTNRLVVVTAWPLVWAELTITDDWISTPGRPPSSCWWTFAAKRSLSPGDLAGCSFFCEHSTEEAACSGQLPGIPFYRGV